MNKVWHKVEKYFTTKSKKQKQGNNEAKYKRLKQNFCKENFKWKKIQMAKSNDII